MNPYRFSLLLILAFFNYSLSLAQQSGHVSGQFLASLQPGQTPQTLTRRFQEEFFISNISFKKISNLLNVWLLETKEADEQKTLEWLARQPEVRAAQLNHLVENRSAALLTGKPHLNDLLPNDPLFPQQWQYVNTGANGGLPDADLDAEMAWDIATGGLTPAGDTIVVAVIDDGIDLNHSDLAPNLWKNWDEIPNDNSDNDGNGYVDDFRGWNVFSQNDNIAGVNTAHGTPVSGIIGARGNNENGVTGVNWNVKIMFVAGSGTEADILAAYDYVRRMRQLYNASNGQSGAFVVAVNSSFGINYGQPSAAPLWCVAFDSLGAAGILSVAATANIPVNVDDVGDLPTTCPSDYLVAVTSLTNADLKAPNAAWGATQIDLGAFGQGVFSTSTNNTYGTHSGTSFAAPQVAGALGLLYSSPCPNLISMAKTNPAEAAIWTKNLLLGSAVPNASLQNITLTGGRLNLLSLLQNYEDQCDPCPPPFALHVLEISTNSALLKWSEIADFQTVTLHWREVGSANWNMVNGVENAYFLENLNPCAEYEFALSAECSQGMSSGWSALVKFKTDGCCEPPAWVWYDWVNSSSASVTWQKITAADGYRLRVRSAGGSWEIHDANSTSFILENLLPCTDYECQVQTLCDTGATAFSNSCFFKTAGCGSCLDAEYCAAKGEHAEEEWIASVAIGTWVHDSGDSNQGYENFTGDLPSTLQIFPQMPVDVTIVPGFSGLPYKEWFRVFIDFNMDGDFDDDGELAFDPAWATQSPVSGQIAPPDFAAPGLTRMRVMMKYKGANNQPPQPCETFDFGQVEDYCVELALPVNSVDFQNENKDQMRIYPQPTSDEMWLELPNEADGVWELTVWDWAGRQMFFEEKSAQEGKVQLSAKNWPTGSYIVQARQNRRVFWRRGMKI
jgi:hypothetical protein